MNKNVRRNLVNLCVGHLIKMEILDGGMTNRLIEPGRAGSGFVPLANWWHLEVGSDQRAYLIPGKPEDCRQAVVDALASIALSEGEAFRGAASDKYHAALVNSPRFVDAVIAEAIRRREKIAAEIWSSMRASGLSHVFPRRLFARFLAN